MRPQAARRGSGLPAPVGNRGAHDRDGAPVSGASRRLTLDVLRRARAATLAVPPAATGKTEAFHHGLLRLIEAAIAAEEELDRLRNARRDGGAPGDGRGRG